MSKVVVLTGGSSFLGRNLLKELVAKGYQIYAFVRKSSVLSEFFYDEKVHLIYGALDSIEVILDTLEKADYFIHLAWDGSGNKGRSDANIQMLNVRYAMDALDIAEKLGCSKFVFSGSQAEYGLCSDNILETNQCNPISEYGKAKLLFSKKANSFCRSKNIEFIHLRIFSVYGEGDREGTLVDSCIRGFCSRDTVYLGPCSQMWNYLYVMDFADIVVKLLEAGCKSGIYNVASTDTRILQEFVKEIHSVCAFHGKYVFGESTQNPEGSPALMPNIDKLLLTIGGYRFTSFEVGVKKIISLMEEKR